MPTIEIIDEIPSTSEALKRRAAAGAGEAALLARRQTAGRGRLGRAWSTIEGNLHFSVLLRPTAPIRPGHWSSLAALALADALRPHAPTLRLKWPNDILVGGAKLAGILLEAGDDHGPWLVIGFGVNLAGAPSGLGRPVTSLGGSISPEAFAPTLLESLRTWRRRYETEAYPPLRAAWLSLGPQPGEPIRTSTAEGAFAGLDDQGALLLDTPSGRRTITSGEVS